jgi:DNA-binding protein
MSDLPLSPIERLIKKAGADRVSGDASEELASLMEEYALRISREAVKLTTHAGRKTVKGKDIKIAAEILK